MSKKHPKSIPVKEQLPEFFPKFRFLEKVQVSEPNELNKEEKLQSNSDITRYFYAKSEGVIRHIKGVTDKGEYVYEVSFGEGKNMEVIPLLESKLFKSD